MRWREGSQSDIDSTGLMKFDHWDIQDTNWRGCLFINCKLSVAVYAVINCLNTVSDKDRRRVFFSNPNPHYIKILLNLTYLLVGQSVNTCAVKPKMVQTHRTLFYFLAEITKFLKIPNMSGWTLGNVSKLMHKTFIIFSFHDMVKKKESWLWTFLSLNVI